jgi:hypothetical protein
MKYLTTPDQVKNLQTALASNYSAFLADLREDVDQGYQSDILTPDFQKEFLKVIYSNQLNEYSSLNFYWLNLIEFLISNLQLIEDLTENPNDDDLLNDIIEFWENSDYTEFFLNGLNEKKGHLSLCKELLHLQESQIITFFHLNINNKRWVPKGPWIYNIINERGDSKSQIYLGPKHTPVALDDTPSSWPFLSVVSFSPDQQSLEVESDNEVHEYPLSTDETFLISHKDKLLYLLPSCPVGQEKFSEHKKKLIQALDLLSKNSPDLYYAFMSFTNIIVPVNEEGIVSYSMQNFPGLSCINFFDRDFVDLLDDLLHENGHHILNFFLNTEELMIEDQDKIYFSPWRRSLRPVRGIYHAYLTFAWAFYLFDSLSKNLDDFNPKEKEKILQRKHEEYFMLSYCHDFLTHAYENNKITEEGYQLLNKTMLEMDAHKHEVEAEYKQIQEDYPVINQNITMLKDFLNAKKVEFPLE